MSAGEDAAMIAVRGPGSERKRSGRGYYETLTADAGPLDAQRTVARAVELWGHRYVGQQPWRRRANGIGRRVR